MNKGVPVKPIKDALEIIEEYNRGKDEVVIKETFRRLIELINSYSEEEADTKREGLTDEQKAIFDILRQGKKLEENEKNEIKKILMDVDKSAVFIVSLWRIFDKTLDCVLGIARH